MSESKKARKRCNNPHCSVLLDPTWKICPSCLTPTGVAEDAGERVPPHMKKQATNLKHESAGDSVDRSGKTIVVGPSRRKDTFVGWLVFHEGSLRGRSIKLAATKTTVGRVSAATVQINEGSVSSEHAFISLRNDGTVYIVDLDSTNGTTVDGTSLDPYSKMELPEQAVIRFGDVTTIFKKF